ncbi:MAG: glycosyltransferase family 2 protein [Chloroflexi bacterium]|nr:glycosyltransferase family 2 protein [Chloroflexota bacterium]
MVTRPDVSAIIVNWNTAALLLRALDSLLGTGGWRLTAGNEGRGVLRQTQDERGTRGRGEACLEVIVVDNGSTDGSGELVRAAFPQVRLVANTHNRGFAAGVNQGLALARGRYLLLLNSDARLEPGSLAALVACLDNHPRVAVVGPRLLNPDGTSQSSRRRFPTLATAFLESTVLQRLWPAHPLLRRYYVLDRSDEETQAVDWLVGACLLVRQAAVEQVGPMDERFFMYSEELDWCRRFKAAGWEVVYVPRARVVHECGKSSERDVLARHIHFNESKCRYVGKHHGRLAEVALRLFLFGTFLFQLGEEGAKLALGHKPALRRGRMRTLLGVLRYQTPRLLTGAILRRAQDERPPAHGELVEPSAQDDPSTSSG